MDFLSISVTINLWIYSPEVVPSNPTYGFTVHKLEFQTMDFKSIVIPSIVLYLWIYSPYLYHQLLDFLSISQSSRLWILSPQLLYQRTYRFLVHKPIFMDFWSINKKSNLWILSPEFYHQSMDFKSRVLSEKTLWI